MSEFAGYDLGPDEDDYDPETDQDETDDEDYEWSGQDD